MSRKLVAAVLILAALALAACRGDANQNASAGANGSSLTGGGTTAGGGAAGGSTAAPRDALAAFPESGAVGFFNARRVFTEVLPRIMPAAELEKMFADAQREAGIDLRQVQYMGVGLRYPQAGAARGTTPEFLIVLKGDFDTTAVLANLAKEARGGHTQEAYKGRTIEVYRKRPAPTTDGDDATPAPSSTDNELHVVVLDPRTMMFSIGSKTYIQAAIDAADGQGRVNPQLAEVVMRNPDNLISFGGDVPASLAETLRGMAPPDPDANRFLNSVRQVQASVSMAAGSGDLKVEANLKADSAESAAWMKQTIDSKLAEGRSAMERQIQSLPPERAQDREDGQMALGVVNSVTSTASGSDLQLSITIPQAVIAKLVERNSGTTR